MTNSSPIQLSLPQPPFVVGVDVFCRALGDDSISEALRLALLQPGAMLISDHLLLRYDMAVDAVGTQAAGSSLVHSAHSAQRVPHPFTNVRIGNNLDLDVAITLAQVTGAPLLLCQAPDAPVIAMFTALGIRHVSLDLPTLASSDTAYKIATRPTVSTIRLPIDMHNQALAESMVSAVSLNMLLVCALQAILAQFSDKTTPSDIPQITVANATITTVRMPSDLHSRAQQVAKEYHVSLNSLLVYGLQRYLQRRPASELANH
jgi:predicted HicB family RNase H-like nuclease